MKNIPLKYVLNLNIGKSKIQRIQQQLFACSTQEFILFFTFDTYQKKISFSFEDLTQFSFLFHKIGQYLSQPKRKIIWSSQLWIKHKGGKYKNWKESSILRFGFILSYREISDKMPISNRTILKSVEVQICSKLFRKAEPLESKNAVGYWQLGWIFRNPHY